MVNAAALIAGIDVPIPELQTTIHQPKIKEIAMIGEEEYFFGIQMFCLNKDIIVAKNQGSEAARNLERMNEFQIFMALLNEQQGPVDKKSLILSVLTLFFPDYIVQFSPLGNGLFFNNAAAQHSFTINETNFVVLKDVIQEIGGLNNAIAGQNSGFNPKGKRAAEIAAKLMAGRARVMGSKGEKNSGILSRYVSILTVGLESMSLTDCLNLTVYQLYDLIERYSLYIGWDLDIKSRLAGGKPDSKPDDWMKDIH